MTYYVVDSTEDKIEPIAMFFDKEEAYGCLKHFCSFYSDGWVEVLSEDEYIAAKANHTHTESI